MKPCRFSRVVWAVALIAAVSLSPTHCLAQGGKWDPPVPSNLFKDGKTEGKNPQPTHRLAPTTCDDCQKIVDQLQAALDNWYVMQLAEGKGIQIDHTDTSAANSEKEQAKNKQVSDAMAGLGQPNGKDLGAKQTQQKKDAKDKKDTHGSKDALAKEIKRLADGLQECLKKCAPKEGGEGETQPETPTPPSGGGEQPQTGGGGEAEKPSELPVPIKLPSAPKCFDTEADREAFLDKWDPIASKERNLAREARVNANAKQGNKQDPWYIYWQKKAEIHEKSADDLQKIIEDAADKTKTPVPCPKKTTTGGGGTSKPTPTPKGKPKKQRTTTGHNISFDDGGAGLSEDFCALISENKIRIDDTFGTGETIGHVADLVIENLTDQPIEVTIPPMVLESRSRKNQHYGSRGGDTVEVPPHSKKKVPLDGICLARNKPPVGKDVGGDLAINDCDPDVHISHDDAHRMMRIAESKYEAADKLEEDGKLKEMPYRDKKKRKEIVEQWSTWMDPRISEITGAPPATKDDLKKVVYKQVEEQGPVTPEKRKKIDEGIDTIFDKIELTTEKAKDLEKQQPEEETPPAISSGTGENISNDTPTPTPQTQEKPKKEKKKKKKSWPKSIQDWVDKKNAADDAHDALSAARIGYKNSLWDYGSKVSPHAKDLAEKWKDADKKANEPGATQADRDAANKALKELEKQMGELEKDYQKTPEGQKEFDKMRDAEKAADKANAAAKEAEKNLPPGVDKDAVQREEDRKKD